MGVLGIACGGTGGHLFPGLAVAEEFMASDHEVRLYISMKKIDRLALEKFPDMNAVELPSIGFPGISPRLVSFFWKFYKAYRKCCAEIKEHNLQAVIGMGGFACAPLVLAALKYRIPVYLHESNAFPGKVTRLLARKVDKVFIGFDACAKHLPRGVTKFVGTPLRNQLVRVDATVAKDYWDLKQDRLTIGVMGGSQGAHGVNHMVLKTLPLLGEFSEDWQFVHITGEGQENLMEMNYRKNTFMAMVKSFCHEMNYFYSACDVVIARSGAASITELASFGMPCILVPYPDASENHQLWNAKILVDKGAAVAVEEGEESSQELAKNLREILTDRTKRAEMSKYAQEVLAGEKAEKLIAKELLVAMEHESGKAVSHS